MQNNLSLDDIIQYINQYLTILDNNFDSKVTKKIPYSDMYDMIGDLNGLFNEYYLKKPVECSKLVNEKYLNLLDLIIKLDNNQTRTINYEKYLKNAYRMASRTSFECYMIYREWDDRIEDRFFAPRFEAIRGYIHYLQEIVTNPNFRLLIFNAMSGFGKTYPEKLSEAWAFGVDPTKTVLSLCSNLSF